MRNFCQYFYLCFIFSLLCFNVSSQDNNNYTWVLGYNPNDSTLGFGGTKIDFNSSPLTLSYFPIVIDANNTAQICDKEGNFLFFTNGCKVVTETSLIPNGDQINPGILHDQWCSIGDHSYGTFQGMIVLPWPGHSGEYALFHLGWNRTNGFPPKDYLQDFYLSRINMNANNGEGIVTVKNTLILNDTNLIDNITAVRHGNGRDWWIVEPRVLSDSIYLLQLTPYGIKGPFVERPGLRAKIGGFTGGQAVFSPDGTKYARVSRTDGIYIYDFDRCLGKFLCGKELPYPGDANTSISGAAISSSSRFLYISTQTKLFQYDLWASDIERSKILIGEYDGFGGILATTFYQQMLAPDGKIYMSSNNATRFLHIIHSPDSSGLACNFIQHDLMLPTHHGFSIPNFPHFQLYDLPSSPCDSLGIDAPDEYKVLWYPSDAIRIFPNPVNGSEVSITIPPCGGGTLRVFNTAGQLLFSDKINEERQYHLDCSNWPNGVYFISFLIQVSRTPMTSRLIICRG